MTSEALRDAVGVLPYEGSFQAAVDAQLISDLDRFDIGVVDGRRAAERKFGAVGDDVADLEDEPEAPRIAYLGCDSRIEAKAALADGLAYSGAIGASGEVVSSGGTLAATVAEAAIAGGVGGLVGGAISNLLGQHDAEYLDQRLARGELLSWVRTADRDREFRACQILKREAARDVHVHDVVHAGPDFVAAYPMTSVS